MFDLMLDECTMTQPQMVGLRAAREITRIDTLEDILRRAGIQRGSRSWREAVRMAGEVWKLRHAASPLN